MSCESSRADDIAIVGCGIIGSAIAKCLLNNQVPLIAYNRTRKKAEDLKVYGDVKVVDSFENVFQANTIIVTLSTINPLISFIESSNLPLQLKQIVLVSNVSLTMASNLLETVKKQGGRLIPLALLSGREEIEGGYATAVIFGETKMDSPYSQFVKNIIAVDYFEQVNALSFSFIAFIHIASPYISFLIALLEKSGIGVDSTLDKIDSLFPNIESLVKNIEGQESVDGQKNREYILSLVDLMSNIGKDYYGLEANILLDIRDFISSIDTEELPNYIQEKNIGTGEFSFTKLIHFFCLFMFMSYKISEKIATSSAITSEKHLQALTLASFGNLISFARVMYHFRWKSRCFVENIQIADHTVFDEFRIVQDWVKKIYQRNIVSNLGTMYEQSLSQNTTEKPRSFASYYKLLNPKAISTNKQQVIDENGTFLNKHKINFLTEAGLDFVIGKRNHLFLYDIDEPQKILLNLHCNGGVFNLGHRNPTLWQKYISSELDIGNHHLISQSRGALAKSLVKTLPQSLSKILFVPSGSEGIDISMKIARAYTGRNKIISCSKVWHGVTGHTVYTTDDSYRKYYGKTPKEYVHVDLWDLEQIENEISDAAAVVYEASPSSYDCSLPPQDFFSKLSQLCHEHGALLIIDEIQTGMGRTGQIWYTDDLEIEIDFLVASKGLTGGIYPMGIVAFKEPLEKFFKESPFMYQSTCAGSELGCELLKHQLDLMDHQFLSHVSQLSDIFSQQLNELKAEYPDIILKINQKGLFISIGFKNDHFAMMFIINSCNYGLFILPCGFNRQFIQFFPPLTISEEEAKLIIRKFRFLLKSLHPAFQLLNNKGISLNANLPKDEQEKVLISIPNNSSWKELGKGLMFTTYQSTSDDLLGKYCKKAMPITFFKTEEAFNEYIKLLKEYTRTLSQLNIPVLYTWFDSSSQQLFQPLIDQESMLIHHLAEGSEQEIRYYFKCLIRIVIKCTENNIGIDALLDNWFVREDGQLCLLDTGQPVMKNHDGQVIAFGSGFVRKLTQVILSNYFDLSFVLKNVVVNMHYSKIQSRFIPILLDEIQEETNLTFSSAVIKKELFVDKALRSLVNVITNVLPHRQLV
jgi:acetylornithine/succinyldiaminopimelate/putrescine aminotransferase